MMEVAVQVWKEGGVSDSKGHMLRSKVKETKSALKKWLSSNKRNEDNVEEMVKRLQLLDSKAVSQVEGAESNLVGLQLKNELSIPYDKTKSHKAAFVFKKYTIPKMKLLKVSMDREKLLIKRTVPVYIFKTIKIIIVAIITSTVQCHAPGNVTSLSVAVLEKFDVNLKKYWYWIGVAALLGFTILFNVLFTFSLIMYLNRKPQAVISEEEANEKSNQGARNKDEGEMENMKVSSQSKAVAAGEYSYVVKDGIAVKKGMILPFTPLSMSFDSVNYFVDMPSTTDVEGAESSLISDYTHKGLTFVKIELEILCCMEYRSGGQKKQRATTALGKPQAIISEEEVNEQSNWEGKKSSAESTLSFCGFRLAQRRKLTILKNVSGIIKTSRMTLLLGPPSSGKTTLLLALSGKLDPSLKVGGQVTYNGFRLDEFVPQKTSAYVSQNDVHLGDSGLLSTVPRYLVQELSKRENGAGIHLEADVDLFMKATAVEGAESNLIIDNTLKLLGLDICKDTIVGDEMQRGISGGQKKRVTTGETIVVPMKTLFMDEIWTAALVLGTIFSQVGTKRENSTDLTMIIEAMYYYVLFVGINKSKEQSFIAKE
ncbi:hypothetical protein LWI29_030582 [Acer saccharum]|uniref:AAA+ ATPase domain-containing protein n=1 Tax=Acer saccharum TaxID=4024 RepID=A0AA39SY59_ACESA|nr:hypothetical protein LWI29_030582 [Acer saccharum]